MALDFTVDYNIPGLGAASKFVIDNIERSNTIINNVNDFDPKYLKSQYWKLDKFSNLTNTWCTIYTDDDINERPITSKLGLVDREQEIATMFGVSISLNKSPKIIETQVKGFNSPVFQQFSDDSFNIELSFLETGPTFFAQNSKKLAKLVQVLDAPQTLNIINPQLNLIYGIYKVVVKSYSIGQDERFYSHNPITISFKQDDSRDILNPVDGVNPLFGTL